ncbi:MAG: oligoribonuclease [Deltaproteobacteria bacterium]|nr:oligoribonuclease [Deltaproteobacteria bacterium]
MNDRLVWIDLEMSGLDPDRHVILEIAAIVTDGNLEVVAEGPDIVIHHPEGNLTSMEAWSQEHHRASGLLKRVAESEDNCSDGEKKTLAFLARHCAKGRSPLCGNSVWQDRRFLVRHMPALHAFLHYRNIDVSSVKELVRRWYPALPAYRKQKAHLALMDIKESIAELKYYREKVFVPVA